jgi:hypothetical protein
MKLPAKEYAVRGQWPALSKLANTLLESNPLLTMSALMCSPILMDTATVLEIIKMIDAQLPNLKQEVNDICEFDTPSDGEMPDYQYAIGSLHTLRAFRDHLQSFIEGQLNAEENKTEQ